jgi:hypothetical protein
MDPRQIRELLDSEFTHWSFFTFPDPFQGQVVAEHIERERRGQRPEAAFGEAPKQGVSLQMKKCTFPIRFAPYLG